MAITDIEISEELMTNAPSIKYSGDEGPKSPQEEQRMMVAQLEEAYDQYVNEMIEMGQEDSIMTLQQFMEQAMAEGQMSGGQPLPSDPTKPVNPFQPKPIGPPLPDRQMAARGGIMGADGRTGFLFGGIKKRIRKLIPNEIAEVAVKAAPFVAPFNPVVGGLMAGIGGFDQTGRIGSSLKSGLMNYGMGQLARGIGGGMDNLQANPFRKNVTMGQRFSGFNPKASTMGQGSISKFFSNPIQKTGGLGKMFTDTFQTSSESLAPIESATSENIKAVGNEADGMLNLGKLKQSGTTGIMETIKGLIPESTLGKVALSGGALMLGTALLGKPGEAISEIMDRGEGLDIEAIRAEVLDAYNDETGQKILALRAKYPFLGNASEKNLKAEGGRIGFAEGGGIMDLGGMEKDYRAEGGFVPIGREEKADDVPARLSVNEFVFTADAVRNAGGGDIDKGAEVMENMMKHLEQGGQVSDESQGMAGAQQMFETSERLSEVI